MRKKHIFHQLFQMLGLSLILGLSVIGCSGGGGCSPTLENPVARAGDDRTIEYGESLTLNGSASYDADGQITEYRWEENGILLGNGETLTLSTLQAGTHTITLTVQDNDHLAATDTLTVQVWSGDVFSLCTYTYGCEPWHLRGDGKALRLIKDILPSTGSSHPRGWHIMGGSIYFFASNAEGLGLWKMDQGPDPVPQLIKTFTSNPFAYTKEEIETAVMNGNLYFALWDFQKNGVVFWKSNGTPSGTTEVGTLQAMPSQFTRIANQLFFVLDDQQHGPEVWVTDGSYGGTHMVSIVQDDSKGAPKELTAYQGKLYFVGNDGGTGDELWRTNGTPAGTIQVADINPGAGNAHTRALTVSGNKLYFAADDGTHGSELWMYDGNSATQLKDIVPGTGSSYPSELTDVAGTLYFTAEDSSHGREVWVSDGTSPGTTLYYDIVSGPASSDPRELTAMGNSIMYVATYSGYGRNIYQNQQHKTMFDTLFRDNFPPRKLFSNGVSLSFVGGDKDRGLEPYWSQYSWMNILGDIKEGPAGSSPQWLGYNTIGNTLYFSANDGIHGQELWMSDGTPLGTYQVKDIAAYGTSSVLNIDTQIANIHYFVTWDTESSFPTQKLYRSDGSTAGTYPLKTLYQFRWMIPFQGRLFFADEHFIYSTDGTIKNTSLYAPSTQLLSIPFDFTKPVIFNNKLYFVGYEQTHGQQLYCIDGTNSLERVSDFPVSDPRFSDLIVMGDHLYFSANDGTTHGIELWKSDGTLGGISLVKDILTGGSSVPKELTLFKNKLYFSARTLLNGRELWVSDGSNSGTEMLTDINNAQLGASSDPKELTISGDHLYFAASGPVRGRELWRTDGTAAHTLPVMDIYPGPEGSQPSDLFAWEGHLVFTADNGTDGKQLWVLPSATEDPWMTHTALYTQGVFAFYPWKVLTVLDHRLFYQLTQQDGTELWVTDGTESGTEMLWKELW